jgi:hypothetical protein
MASYRTIRVKELAHFPIAIVTLSLDDYGSLSFSTLSSFGSELLQLAQEGQFGAIVLDLGESKRFGAGFLGCVARLHAYLLPDHRALILCGDDRGLLRAAGWDRFIRLYPTLVDALNRCLDPHEGQTGGVPPPAHWNSSEDSPAIASLADELRPAPVSDTLRECGNSRS